MEAEREFSTFADDTNCGECKMYEQEKIRLEAEIERLQESLKLAHGAIVDAIATEDGMDGEDGLVVLRSIEAVMPSLKIEVAEAEEE